MKMALVALGLLALTTAHADDFCGKRSKTVFFNTFSYDFRQHRGANPETSIINVTGVPWAPGASGTIKGQLNGEMDQALSNKNSAGAVKDFLGKVNFASGTKITFTSSNGALTIESNGIPTATIQDPSAYGQLISFIERIITDRGQNDGGEVQCSDFSVK